MKHDNLALSFNQHQLGFLQVILDLHQQNLLPSIEDLGVRDDLKNCANALGISKTSFKAHCAGLAQASWSRAQAFMAQGTNTEESINGFGMLLNTAARIGNVVYITLLLGGQPDFDEKTMKALKIDSAALSNAAHETMQLLLHRYAKYGPDVVAAVEGWDCSDAVDLLTHGAGYSIDDDTPYQSAGFKSKDDFLSQNATWIQNWEDKQKSLHSHGCCNGGCTPS